MICKIRRFNSPVTGPVFARKTINPPYCRPEPKRMTFRLLEYANHAKNKITGRIILFLLEMPRSRYWPGNPGDMAWCRCISGVLSQKPSTKNQDTPTCNLIISVVSRTL